MIMLGSSFKLYKASRSSFVGLLNPLEGISVSSNLSSKQLRYVSMMTSLFLALKEDLGLNLSAANYRSSFLKCSISPSFLPYPCNSVINFARSILLAVGTKSKPLDSNEILEAERFLLKRFTTFLLTRVPSNITPICEAMLFPFKTLPSFSQLPRSSVLLNFSFFLSSV